MASVRFCGVSKSYGETRVLDGIDIEVEDGEFLVLVGPSGCGKSTLLRCLAGLNDLSSGEILLGGSSVNDLPPKDRDVAMVFQSYALYPHMTVSQNMGFALKMRRIPKEEIEESVGQAAKLLGLEPLLSRYPKELSGGQRQRVAMGRAIVRRPQVFLFDEPLSNLDAKLRNQLRVELKQLHRTLETTMIYVTHDQVEAMTLADRIAVLNEGILQQLGSPTELYEKPANRFVAGFIGSPSMSFLQKVSDDAVVGVRPHDVILGDGDLGAEVLATESMGFESFVHLDLNGEALTARVEGTPPARGHCKIGLRNLHRFDRKSGIRIGS
jgi:multiple sugar transport system ATP-binding protein